jgi:hypothetical protein
VRAGVWAAAASRFLSQPGVTHHINTDEPGSLERPQHQPLLSLLCNSTSTSKPHAGPIPAISAAMATPEEKGMQPQARVNWSSFFYFVAFVIVVSYTLLNLYIGEQFGI